MNPEPLPFNTIVYSRSGQRGRIVSPHPNGGYLVECAWEASGDPDGRNEWFADTEHWQEVLNEAPRLVWDQQVRDLQDKHDRLRIALRDERAAMETEIKAHTKLLEKIRKQSPILERISDFLDGKITHYLMGEAYEWNRPQRLWIASLEDAKGRAFYERGLKLLSLYGRSNGNLQWAINQYYDDFGFYKTWVWPCCSEEEAKEKFMELLNDQIANWQIEPASDKYYSVDNKAQLIVENCKTIGLPVPDDVQTYLRNKKLSSIQISLANARAKASELEIQLHAAANPTTLQTPNT